MEPTNPTQPAPPPHTMHTLVHASEQFTQAQSMVCTPPPHTQPRTLRLSSCIFAKRSQRSLPVPGPEPGAAEHCPAATPSPAAHVPPAAAPAPAAAAALAATGRSTKCDAVTSPRASWRLHTDMPCCSIATWPSSQLTISLECRHGRGYRGSDQEGGVLQHHHLDSSPAHPLKAGA